MTIIKRNGKVESLSKKKISDSLVKANNSVKDEDRLTQKQLKRIAESVVEFCENLEEPISIDVLEDVIEQKIMASGGYEVAKKYITYRYEKERLRTNKSLTEKLTAANVQNQNANVDEFSFGGRIGETASYITKNYALEHLVSKMARHNHNNNEIYIHDLDSYAVGMHNCCDRNTKFLTDTGVDSFAFHNDGDTVMVLTHRGRFQKAVVRSYGTQKLYTFTFSRSGQRFVQERFTKDHRWILADGTETTDLKVGDKLFKPQIDRKFDFVSASDREKYYWCLGFVLADGTEAVRWSHGVKNPNVKFVRLRLCGDKITYSDRFSTIAHSTKEMDNGDLYLTFSSTIGFRKEFPDLKTMSWKEKLALFDGLYSADGQHVGSKKSIYTTDEQIASFIEDVVPSLGYFILKEDDLSGEKTNYGVRGFGKEYTFTGDTNKYFWTVVSIDESTEETVWCLEVEEDHSFVLPNGIVTGNCLSIPFDKLLKDGFNTRQCDIRPASSINTAFQLVAVLFQIQSLQQFGGVSATHLDWTMVPYVRLSFWKHYWDGVFYILKEPDAMDMSKDDIRNLSIDSNTYNKDSEAYAYAMDKTMQELEQAVEGMYHNLNTLQSRSGCQLPFTSINYGTCTLTEGRMVIKALLNGSIKGVGKFHKTPIFPCGIFQSMNGVNRKPGDPNYDLFQLALKSTSLRLYPNYANVDWTGNAGYDPENPCTYFSTMGCRTANGYDINCDDPKLGQLKDGRGNICPVTIIMPTLAMQAKKKVDAMVEKDAKNNIDWQVGAAESKTVEEFMKLLEKKIGEAKDMLLERFDWICSQPAKSARFMYENGTMYGYKPEEGIRSALKHGTLALGQLGLAETLQILIGCDHTTESGMELAKRIEGLFKEKCAKFKKDYKLNFGVYYTPAENLCFTAMKKFKEAYGEIKNVSDKDYFTNSMHIPVWHKLTPFEKIDKEAELTPYSSAGCITYVELDSSTKNNVEALEKLVNYAMDKDIPYFAINVPNDSCSDCGFTGDIPNKCPKCGSENIQRLRRVTGYLTGDYKTAFNYGKQKETESRVKHTGVEA